MDHSRLQRCLPAPRSSFHRSQSGLPRQISHLTYELDFCIHWLDRLHGLQQPVKMVLQSLSVDSGLQGLWYVFLQLFPVPKSRD